MTDELAKQLRAKLAAVRVSQEKAGLDLPATMDSSARPAPTPKTSFSHIGDQLAAALDHARAQRASVMQSAQLDHWGRAGAAGLGLGSVLAGLAATRRARQERKKKEYPVNVNDMPIPYAVSKNAGVLDSVASSVGSAAGQGMQSAGNAFTRTFLTPDDRVTTPTDLSTYPIGLGAAAAGGLFLGRAGVGAVLKHMQKSREEAEIEKKRNEFKQELLNLYSKTAEPLSRAYAAIEKSADLGNKIRNMSLLAATVAAPYGFAQQYAASRKNDERKAIEQARRLRARLRESQQPSDLYASLEPVVREPAIR